MYNTLYIIYLHSQNFIVGNLLIIGIFINVNTFVIVQIKHLNLFQILFITSSMFEN